MDWHNFTRHGDEMKLAPLTVFLLFLFIFPASSFSNPDSIGVSKVDGKNYVVHKVENSEGWFSIARHYGITYSELRMANKDSTDMLVPGMSILVPIERPKPGDPFYDKNYIQTQEEIFHSVKEGETLFSIAKRYSTTVDSLKKWNKLSEASLKVGQRLKVGYKNKSDVKAKDVSVASDSLKPNVKIISVGDGKEEKAATGKIDTSKKTTPVKKAEVKSDSTNLIKTASEMKADTKKTPVSSTGKGRKEITETGIASWIRDDDINPNKYYALHRSAPIGTIIRVTNKMNSKYVFVKVVGTLPDTGDNTDLLIKISKASAEKLGVRDSKFQSELSYGITEKK
jgi:LysM repeat protein